jgi:hypothetical protein
MLKFKSSKREKMSANQILRDYQLNKQMQV